MRNGKLKDSTPWSAVTCHRFGLRRLDAVQSGLNLTPGGHDRSRPGESGDQSPHSKKSAHIHYWLS